MSTPTAPNPPASTPAAHLVPPVPLTVPASAPPATAAAPATAAPAPSVAAPPPPKKGKRKRKSLTEWAKDIRALYWSGVTDDQVWSSAAGGWTSIPRALGLICEVAIKEAHRKMFDASSAAGTTYMTIWMHSQASGVARIESEEDAAFESGYGGERGITTFRRHLRTLKQMGFIDFIEEGRGRVKWVLIYNPYQVVKRLYEDGHLDKHVFRAVSERAIGIGVSHELEDEEVGAVDAAK